MQTGVELAVEHAKQFEAHASINKIGIAIGGSLLAATASLGLIDQVPTREPQRLVTSTIELSPAVPRINSTEILKSTPVQKPKPLNRPEIPPRALRERLPIEESDRRAMAKIANMQLTPEGYAQAVRSIDRSLLSFAQTFREFNPNKVKVDIEQAKSEKFILHFTTFYRNADGLNRDRPIGKAAIKPIIQGMAQTGDDDVDKETGKPKPDRKCCGINWIIDRSGQIYQVAPLNAKLRHNPPDDSSQTGVEIEAYEQADITTEQYEAAGYLAIFVLEQQNLLSNRPLSEVLDGHGKLRDIYRENHPNSIYGVRDDFNAGPTAAFRQKVASFLFQSAPSINVSIPLLG